MMMKRVHRRRAVATATTAELKCARRRLDVRRAHVYARAARPSVGNAAALAAEATEVAKAGEGRRRRRAGARIVLTTHATNV